MSLVPHNQVAKEVLDIASAVTAVAALAQWLPSLAALFTIIWTGLRIWDWVQGRRTKQGDE